jgi:hypothetical protein
VGDTERQEKAKVNSRQWEPDKIQTSLTLNVEKKQRTLTYSIVKMVRKEETSLPHPTVELKANQKRQTPGRSTGSHQ